MLFKGFTTKQIFLKNAAVSPASTPLARNLRFITALSSAIISSETFETTLAKKEVNRIYNPRRSKNIYLLSSLLYCDECGMRFYVSSRSGSHKYRLADGTERICRRKRNKGHYVCRGTKDYPHIYNCRTPNHIGSDDIESLVWEKIDEVLRNPEMLRVAIKNRIEELQAGINGETQKRNQA